MPIRFGGTDANIFRVFECESVSDLLQFVRTRFAEFACDCIRAVTGHELIEAAVITLDAVQDYDIGSQVAIHKGSSALPSRPSFCQLLPTWSFAVNPYNRS